MNNFEMFREVYTQFLAEQHAIDPEYCWSIEELPKVVDRMMEAFKSGGANVNSIPTRRTCKKIGIKVGIKSIRNYLNEEDKQREE
jgi:hypothetical protein